MTAALTTLKSAIQSYEPYLQPNGDLLDLVIGQPSVTATANFAYGQAVLAQFSANDERTHHLTMAISSFQAALRHLTNPERKPELAGLNRETGAATYRDQRALCWWPLLKAYRILQLVGIAEATQFGQQLAEIDILSIFGLRPPDHRALMGLAGEWLRIQARLSPFDTEKIDEWLGQFFESPILLGPGFYQTPGLSNALDLLGRTYLAEMLAEGYTGAWQREMMRLLESGFQRSLNVQLSDGSLASARQGTGQTWTLGAQCAYFTYAAQILQNQGLVEGQPQAQTAAQRAFAALVRWQLPQQPYNAAENLLPTTYQVGGHNDNLAALDGTLALAFLAAAIEQGFSGLPDKPLPVRQATTFIEGDPTDRVIIHSGRYSLHANARPVPGYDGFGLTDLSFGPGKLFQVVSGVRHTGSGRIYQLGLALRREAGLAEIQPIAQQSMTLLKPIAQSTADASFILTARPAGAVYTYELMAQLHDDGAHQNDGAHIEERTPKYVSHKTLLIPYLRDNGSGQTTQIDITGAMIRLRLGHEQVCMEVYGQVENALHLPYGFESPRGLCGLIRLDMAEPREGISYRIVSEG